ncbi:MAG: ribonuclease T2 [Sulfitobacter sp.]|jgi:ribonuclease T2
MHRLLSALFVTLISLAPAAHAKGEQAGDFEYFVLALSWSPNWCAREGDARNSPQCRENSGHGWILHGLWPQFHRGFPSYCQSIAKPPNRNMTAAMADIMGTSGLAWHQWQKHGSCTGLSAAEYYALSRKAYARVIRPGVFRRLTKSVKLPASVVEAAFLKANPDMEPDGVTITCKDRHIQEVRICLSRTLTPVPCGSDVVRDCKMNRAVFTPLR